MAGGKRPCFPPCLRKRIKAEFGYDDRKGVVRVIADPLGGEVDGRWGCKRGRFLLASMKELRAFKAKLGSDLRKGVGACERGCMITDPLGRKTARDIAYRRGAGFWGMID